MLISRHSSCLLIVDIQEKLYPVIHDSQKLIDNSLWLVDIAQQLDVPVLVSEQYPKGLGHTHGAFTDRIEQKNVMHKLHFSCAKDTACLAQIESSGAQQVIIVGMEAHVCVLQTVLGLLREGKDVFVVADAVSSRTVENRTLALQRMQQCGAHIVSREMVAYEWLEKAGNDEFRQISRNYLR